MHKMSIHFYLKVVNVIENGRPTFGEVNDPT